MPYTLKGRNVLVTGGSRYAKPGQRLLYHCVWITKTNPRGLGALIAEKFAAEGCNVAINYVSNLERAKETAAKIEKECGAKTVVIQGVGCFEMKNLGFGEAGGIADTFV